MSTAHLLRTALVVAAALFAAIPVSAHGITGSGSCSTLANGIPASAELPGADSDFFGATCGIGRLRFSAADATPNPSNPDAAGTTSVAARIALNNPTSGSLLNKNQSFEAATYWNFATQRPAGVQPAALDL